MHASKHLSIEPIIRKSIIIELFLDLRWFYVEGSNYMKLMTVFDNVACIITTIDWYASLRQTYVVAYLHRSYHCTWFSSIFALMVYVFFLWNNKIKTICQWMITCGNTEVLKWNTEVIRSNFNLNNLLKRNKVEIKEINWRPHEENFSLAKV